MLHLQPLVLSRYSSKAQAPPPGPLLWLELGGAGLVPIIVEDLVVSEALWTRPVGCSGDWVVPGPMLESVCAGWEGVCVTELHCGSGGLLVVGVVAGVGGTAAVSFS